MIRRPQRPFPDPPVSPEITLTRAVRPPFCVRCGREGLLSASVPAQQPGDAARELVLCPRCDADDDVAGPLVLFFAVHGEVTAPHAEQFAGLLRTWADHAVARWVQQP